MKKAIHRALSKEPAERPETAEAFASELRSRSEGIWSLLRRSLVIYSEHLPKFLGLSAFFSLPIIVLTSILLVLSFMRVSDLISESLGNVLIGIDGFALSIATAFCTNLIVGTIAWVVVQYLAVPLRPVRLRPALGEARKKWKRMAGAGVLTAILPFVCAAIGVLVGGILLAGFGGFLYLITGAFEVVVACAGLGATIGGLLGFFWAYVSWILVPPVIMLENVGIRAALRRSRQLVKRSFMTSAAAICIMLIIPAIIAGAISYTVNVSARAFDPKPKPSADVSNSEPSADEEGTSSGDGTNVKIEPARGGPISWVFGEESRQRRFSEPEKDMRTRVRGTVLESLTQIFWMPMQIIVFSFSAIIVGLLYLKTRLAGGESMNDLVERFEDSGRPIKKWQERVRQRLIQSGRISSNPSR
jgi:hypothetical protein